MHAHLRGNQKFRLIQFNLELEYSKIYHSSISEAKFETEKPTKKGDWTDSSNPFYIGAGARIELVRYLVSRDFKSLASTYSATRARVVLPEIISSELIAESELDFKGKDWPEAPNSNIQITNKFKISIPNDQTFVRRRLIEFWSL